MGGILRSTTFFSYKCYACQVKTPCRWFSELSNRTHPLLEDSIQEEAQLGVVAGLMGCKVIYDLSYTYLNTSSCGKRHALLHGHDDLLACLVTSVSFPPESCLQIRYIIFVSSFLS
jgi:hypothetical protein